MRYPARQKDETRKKILEAAGRVFRREGYHASGVDKVMNEAGLTAGGFYAHFRSKEALLAEALVEAGTDARRHVERSLLGLSGRGWVHGFLTRYLGKEHCASSESGCPLAALVSEASRADETVKASVEALVRDLQDRLAAHAGPDPVLAGQSALAVVSMCVGGLGLARAVKDRDLANRILDSCRQQAERILCGHE